MTELISRNYGGKSYEVIIKTDSKEHYDAAQEFARRLIDNSVVANKWVPVTERLPEEDGQYLTYSKSGTIESIEIYWFQKNYKRKKNIWSIYDSEWGDVVMHGVTHWMPLPTPPKEGE